MRRICRELSSNWLGDRFEARRRRRSVPSSSRCTISCAMRCASSTGALPGASSGRQRRHGRKPACSASCGVSKKRQLASFGVLAGQIGRQ